MKQLRKIWEKLNAFWFADGDPLTLGILRASVGLVASVNTIYLLYEYDIWFTDYGFVPRNAVTAGWRSGLLSLLSGPDNDFGIQVFFIITILSALWMAIGFHTRISVWLTWFGVFTLHQRNPFIIHGWDSLLRITLFFLAFSRCGEAFSVDRWLKSRRTGDSSIAPVPLWPQKMIQYMLTLMYLSSVAFKLKAESWRDGSAVYYSMRLEGFQRFGLPAFLTQPPFTTAMTYATLFFELAMGIVIFTPKLRKWILPMGVALHLMILVTMNIPFFPELVLVLYISYFSGEEIRSALIRLNPFRGSKESPLKSDIALGQARGPIGTVDLE